MGTIIKNGVAITHLRPQSGAGSNHPYLSIERLRKYLYRVTFDALSNDSGNNAPVMGACSAYVKDGKLHRNFDFKYDNAASFIVRTNDFEGLSMITGLNDGRLEDAKIAQLPFRMVDGRNNYGISLSVHLLFNDWQYTGAGDKSIPLTRLPFEVLSRVKSMATIAVDLADVIGNLSVTDAMGDYILQLLITDGTTTYALIPPTSEGSAYVLEDATSNPKMSNFRWVSDANVERADLQTRPTGVERFNMMPCALKDLRFTKAYEAPTRLSEFIGIDGTDKDSTDEELTAIYNLARAEYLQRQRDGKTWQTMHSVVYGDKMEELYIQENWEDNIIVSGGGGGEPSKYIKSAAVSQDGNTLTLTKEDDTTVEFSPAGGGGDIKETVNVILSSSDDSGIEIGKEVTVVYGDVSKTEPYVAGGIQFEVPTSMEYIIRFEPASGYVEPQTIRRIAQPGNTITFDKEYTLGVADVVYLNQGITDPATMLSGDINGPIIRWIRDNTHRYLGKNTESGKMVLCQLLDTDSTKYHDGTTASLDGTEGDVFTKLPVFWYKVEQTDTNIFKISISRVAVDGFLKFDGDSKIIGTYEAYSTVNNKLYSRSGVVPSGNISQGNFKAYARARGQGFTLVTWEWNCVMAMLYYCQYGHMNCQSRIGSGTASYEKVAGLTNAKGMADTVAGVDGDSSSINFWGIENWWGDKWEWIDNVAINISSVNDVWHVTEDDGTDRTFKGLTVTGNEQYITKCVLGPHFDLAPTAVGASSSSAFCDAHWYTRSVGRVVKRGGRGAGAYGGVASSIADNDASSPNALFGSRLAFRGNVDIETSVGAFKALTPIG